MSVCKYLDIKPGKAGRYIQRRDYAYICLAPDPVDADKLEALADEVGADKQKLCAFFKVASIRDIPASKDYAAQPMLEKKREQK